MILTASPSAKFAIILQMTERDDNILNISWLCEFAGVSRAGYYKWIATESKRAQRASQD